MKSYNKKGILQEETVKIIIAVISIVILVYLAYSLYSMLIGSKEKDQAESVLKQILDRAKLLKDGESYTMTITGPRYWFLFWQNNLLCVIKCEVKDGLCAARDSSGKNTLCMSVQGLQIELPIEGITVYLKDIVLKRENDKVSISKK